MILLAYRIDKLRLSWYLYNRKLYTRTTLHLEFSICRVLYIIQMCYWKMMNLPISLIVHYIFNRIMGINNSWLHNRYALLSAVGYCLCLYRKWRNLSSPHSSARVWYGIMGLRPDHHATSDTNNEFVLYYYVALRTTIKKANSLFSYSIFVVYRLFDN